MPKVRIWTVYEHGGGRTVSSDQCDHWKEPLQVVALPDVLALFEGDSAIAYGTNAGMYPADVIAAALDERC